MFYTGIDIGSTATKAVVFDETKEKILHKLIIPSGWNSKETSEKVLQWLESEGVTPDNSVIISTGYGRISVPYADKQITEITCHGKGALFLHPEDCTVIDIGGQDTKIIYLKDGMVTDFIMNDKCSAGTGKFLEVMANRLGITMQEMFELAEKGEPITISSMCTVFAESEVVSLIAQNKATDDIVHGLNKAVASKTAALAKRVGGEERYMMTGGVSKNQGLVKTLEEKLGTTLVISDKAQLCGALGAALFAKDMVTE